MGYKLVAQNGDSLAVPRLVLTHLSRTDGDTVRTALYLLDGGSTDAQTIAHDLGLKSVEAAKRALQYWTGAGLLMKERGATVPEETPAKPDNINLSTLRDPNVAILCEEAQNAFGKALGRSEMQRLVALYLNEGWQPDVIMLCCTEVARQGRRTVAAVGRELGLWRENHIETGEDAEKYLKQQRRREEWYDETAKQFGIDINKLTRWERGAIARWHEQWHMDAAMVDEALLRAETHRTVRYVDGILRSWISQGLTTIAAVRGKGQLSGSNILATGAKAAAPKKDLFHRDWNAVFDDDTEG